MNHRCTDDDWRALGADYHADSALTLAAIGRRAGCHYTTVMHHFARLGIARKSRGPHTWGPAHTAYLIAHADTPFVEQAQMLGRTVAHVKRRRAPLLAAGLIPRKHRSAGGGCNDQE